MDFAASGVCQGELQQLRYGHIFEILENPVFLLSPLLWDELAVVEIAEKPRKSCSSSIRLSPILIAVKHPTYIYMRSYALGGSRPQKRYQPLMES